MAEALQDGARRRSIAALTTPVTGKRALKKSPMGGSTASTVTPDAKRHMTSSGDGSAKSTASASATKAPVTTVPPVELFPAPAPHDGPEKQDMAVEDADLEATQIDGSPVGWVWIASVLNMCGLYGLMNLPLTCFLHRC